MWPAGETGTFVGRAAELATLRSVVDDLVTSGRGRAILLGGEPGIGKTALLAYGLGGAAKRGAELGWADADEFSTRFPLRVMLDCLGVEPRAADPRRAALALLLGGHAPVPAGSDPLLLVVERLVSLVEQVCADRPLVLVANHLQWADELSLLVWCRLARLTARLPLVLVGAYRPVPRRPELRQLRQAAERESGLALALEALRPAEVTELVTSLAGGTPGPHLTRLVERAAGNPLYVRESVDALRFESAVTVNAGTADIPAGLVETAPASLAAAIDRRLEFLTPGAVTALRAAALLGTDFAVTDLAAVLERPASELVEPLAEAGAAGVVLAAGTRLTFRHPLIRQALYEAIPATVRAGLHRHAAQALHGTGACPERVAAHLTRAPSGGDAWVTAWLVRYAAVLTDRAPEVAAELLARTLARLGPEDPSWARLAVAQARTLFRLGRDAAPLARQALAACTDPVGTAELCWILGALLLRGGRTDEAREMVRQGLDRLGTDRLGVPAVWRARLGAMAAVVDAYATGESPATERAAQEALTYAQRTGDPMAIGYCLFGLSTVHLVRRDQTARLGYLDRALAVLGDDPAYLDLRLLMLANRAFALHLLDRFTEAEKTLDEARRLVERAGQSAPTRLHLPAAVIAYCTGRWDDALAELAAAGTFPDSPRHAAVVAGLAALIACHRDDRSGALEQLARLPDGADLNCGFALTARALLAERDGEPARARDILAVVLTPRYARLERHMLLPHLVRMALAAQDPTTARAAVDAAEADAEAQPTPARLAAVAYCRGLLTRDAESLHRAVEHFERVRRVVDLAQAREELAVAYSVAGDTAPARVQANAAKEGYGRIDAAWAVRRTDARLRTYGVRMAPRGPRRTAACGGWNSLSPTEMTIARLVAQGRSNPDIASELLLSRRTVQSHVSSILAKLHARTRVEIAREAARHL
jgi:DNA-binding CsgD family transcriptional regulator/tetratricopeptide (TPR) repeat protein